MGADGWLPWAGVGAGGDYKGERGNLEGDETVLDFSCGGFNNCMRLSKLVELYTKKCKFYCM